MDWSILKRYWWQILLGGLALGLLWRYMSGSSSSATTTTTAGTTGPTAAEQAMLISAQGTANANMIAAGGVAQANVINAQTNMLNSYNQVLIADYAAGTSMANTALEQAGAIETTAITGAAASNIAFAKMSGEVGAATAQAAADAIKASKGASAGIFTAVASTYANPAGGTFL